MIKRLAVVITLLVLVGTVSCTAVVEKPVEAPVDVSPQSVVPVETTLPVVQEAPVVQAPVTEVKEVEQSSVQYVSVPGMEAKLFDIDWVSPTEVEIGNYYPGARAEWLLRVHNGSDSIAKYDIGYRIPYSNNLRDGCQMPPAEAEDWVVITDSTIIIMPKETREVLVVLAIPNGAEVSSKKWEFWTSVAKQGQGMVATEVCVRWLINMR